MAVIKVVELVGTSEKSWEDAVRQVVAEASKSLRHIRGVDVMNQTAHVEGGKLTEFRTTCRIAFALDKESAGS